MIEMELKINGRIEVLDEDGITYLKSNIQDITDEGIYITIPMKEGKYLPLNIGQSVSIIYYRDQDVYQFDGDVIGRTVNVIPMIILSQPRNIRVIQRRNYVRVLVINTVKYLKIDRELAEKDIPRILNIVDSNNFKQATVLDLSGGGMRFKTDTKLKLNDYLLISLSLINEEIMVKTKIVRCEMQPDKTYICGLTFLDLGELTREKIIKYIFHVMREQRKKGLKGD